jgi:hypothetical protein
MVLYRKTGAERVKLLLLYLTMLAQLHTASNGRMIMNDKLGRMWEEVVVTYPWYYPVSEWKE